ncbi:MAG: hypothetical protein ACLPVW_08375 [Terriglobales bacterium]
MTTTKKERLQAHKRRGEKKRRKRMASKFIPDEPWGGLFTHPAYLWQARTARAKKGAGNDDGDAGKTTTAR